MGSTSGTTVIIALGQIDSLLGAHSEGVNVTEKLNSYQTIGFSINTASLIMGGLVVLGMFIYPRERAKRTSSSLLAITLATAVMLLSHLPVATVGKILQTLTSSNRLNMGGFSFSTL